MEACRSNEYTDLIMVHEHRGEPDGLVVCHLPYGPTAYFGLFNAVRPSRQHPRACGWPRTRARAAGWGALPGWEAQPAAVAAAASGWPVRQVPEAGPPAGRSSGRCAGCARQPAVVPCRLPRTVTFFSLFPNAPSRAATAAAFAVLRHATASFHLPFLYIRPFPKRILSSPQVLRHDIGDKGEVGTVSEAYPHLIFNNFSSKLGARCASILKFLFPVPKPDTKRVMTFANQVRRSPGQWAASGQAAGPCGVCDGVACCLACGFCKSGGLPMSQGQRPALGFRLPAGYW